MKNLILFVSNAFHPTFPHFATVLLCPLIKTFRLFQHFRFFIDEQSKLLKAGGKLRCPFPGCSAEPWATNDVRKVLDGETLEKYIDILIAFAGRGYTWFLQYIFSLSLTIYKHIYFFSLKPFILSL